MSEGGFEVRVGGLGARAWVGERGQGILGRKGGICCGGQVGQVVWEREGD